MYTCKEYRHRGVAKDIDLEANTLAKNMDKEVNNLAKKMGTEINKLAKNMKQKQINWQRIWNRSK